jgi:prepilin-type N-terminal cleavage/methylation domain-containing protein/prepilin-type processing-associated H-X9-DG protein
MACGKRRRSGFTLVELLVVIGIIALLISILLPTLSSARGAANALKCSANLRQIGNFALLYANDNHGFVPRNYERSDTTQFNKGAYFYAEVFAKYQKVDINFLGTTDPNYTNRDKLMQPQLARCLVYRCPSYAKEDQLVTYVTNARQNVNNTAPSQGEFAFKLTKMRWSSEVAYAMDGALSLSTTDYGSHDIFQDIHLPMGSSPRTPNPKDKRHKDNVNILWVDGHVTAKKFGEITFRDLTWYWRQ